MSHEVDYGPCCICERQDSTVRNILMLPKRSPYGQGWGCVQCGLALEGATAIVCDRCFRKHKEHVTEQLKFFCKPDGPKNYIDGRAAYSELDSQPVWEHDMRLHPEAEE
jgi:hypothetical protein